MIIDIYNHILPMKYQEALEKKVTGRDMNLPSANWSKTVPTLLDLEARFRLMDDFEGYTQVLTVASPPTYSLADPPLALELCRIANDELAELVHRYPDRFAAGIATLPMNDPEAAVVEGLIPPPILVHHHAAWEPSKRPWTRTARPSSATPRPSPPSRG